MPAPKGYVQIGTIGVDAGLCMIGDPCYVIDRPLGKGSWDAFLDARTPQDEDAAHWELETSMAVERGRKFPCGLLVTTGDGDGEYPVYAKIEDGRVRKVIIDFGG
jgi:hypothetical protein